MKYARAKRAKILFVIVKYANLGGFCCRRRRGCLSSRERRKWIGRSAVEVNRENERFTVLCSRCR